MYKTKCPTAIGSWCLSYPESSELELETQGMSVGGTAWGECGEELVTHQETSLYGAGD
jgi:hypothetical protein